LQYKWVALAVTMVGTLMAGIDDRILVVGLPTISREMGVSVEAAIWISQAYTLASTACLLLVGRIADIHGRIKIYNIGFVIFTVGSTLAAASFSAEQLIASRLVQGVGAAMLSGNSIVIVTDAAPPRELGRFIGYNQIAFRAGAVLGLTLSGVILAFADWRALFYINIPIGIFGTVWAYRMLKEVSVRDVGKPIDWQGFLTFTGGISLVLVGITSLGYGTSELVESSVMVAAGVVLIASFVKIEIGVRAPLLDLRLFKIKSFAVGSSVMLFDAIAWNGVLYMMSFFLQIDLGLSALQAGLGYLGMEASFLVAALASGRIADARGPRLFTTAGLIIVGIACFSAASFTTSTTYVEALASLAVLAMGQGMFTTTNRLSIMRSVPSNRRGVAAGFSGMLFQVGDVAGPVIALTVITLGISYSDFTALVQNPGALGAGIVKTEFIDGFRTAALALGLIDAIAVVPSLIGARAPWAGRVQDTKEEVSGIPQGDAG
jgi:EmrB/QacA subfamily drug resistance transporter